MSFVSLLVSRQSSYDRPEATIVSHHGNSLYLYYRAGPGVGKLINSWCVVCYAGCQLVSVSELLAAKLRVPADGVTSLVGHVVGVFSPHLGALCEAYDTYLSGIVVAGDTVRQLVETNDTFADYVDVMKIFTHGSIIKDK